MRTGRNLRKRLRGVSRIAGRLSRARYFRGHGVHSPFVYSMVREGFMKHTLQSGEHTLYDALCREGIPSRRAVQLQNVFSHCGYRTFGLNGASQGDMCILTGDFPQEQLLPTVRRVAEAGATLCVMEPYANAVRIDLCRRIVRDHPSTTVDNRGYLLVFNNHLPKQHFRL